MLPLLPLLHEEERDRRRYMMLTAVREAGLLNGNYVTLQWPGLFDRVDLSKQTMFVQLQPAGCKEAVCLACG